MKINHLQTFCQKNIFEIVKGLTVDININENPNDILCSNNLFKMAMRINPKRRFLFVSKVLGKHIPVEPSVPMLTGTALALRFMQSFYGIDIPIEQKVMEGLKTGENLHEIYKYILNNKIEPPEKLVFIGFAETATALGYSMFEFFLSNCVYLHTTREKIYNLKPTISFEEEHSHAISHRLYDCCDALNSESPVILVDDEITTGKTVFNIINSIHKLYKRKDYIVASILDWRSQEDKELFYELEEKLKINVTFISLLSGEITVHQNLDALNSFTNEMNTKNISYDGENKTQVININLNKFKLDVLDYSSTHSYENNNGSSYLKLTGRFGVDSLQSSSSEDILEKIGQYLGGLRSGRSLCLGTEEFMHIPMKIASYMGDGVKFHSTTRSPIYPMNKKNYAIKNAIEFKSPNEVDIINYVYNIPYNYYDELFMFFERNFDDKVLQPMLSKLKGLGIAKIYVIRCQE